MKLNELLEAIDDELSVIEGDDFYLEEGDMAVDPVLDELFESAIQQEEQELKESLDDIILDDVLESIGVEEEDDVDSLIESLLVEDDVDALIEDALVDF